jgi:hypothetical protein
VLVLALVVQEHGPEGVTERKWVFGLDFALFAVVVGFRTGKEMMSYQGPVNMALTGVCGLMFVAGLGVPLFQ